MDQDPTTTNQETAPAVHEVDSNYTKRDIKIPPEKSRAGLIIGIVVAILVLLCGGIVLWFYLWYSNPNQVAYDAVNHLIKAENVGLEGGFTIYNSGDDDSVLKAVSISFDQASSSLPSSTSARISFIFDAEKVEGEPHVLIDVKNIVMQDGVIYLQIAGLLDSINSVEIDEETRSAMEVYINTLELIDNEWWQISIPDLLQTMELPGEQSSALTEVYQCAVQAFNSNMSEEVAKIYKQNQFVQITPSKTLGPSDSYNELTAGHKAYELTIDKDKMASFVNQLPETTITEEFFGCVNQVMDKYGGNGSLNVSDIEEITADDISWLESDEMRVFLEISQFDHKLRSISVYEYDDGENIGGGTILVKYDAVNVTAPENYRPITELFDELSEMFSQIFTMTYDDEELEWE